MAYQPSAEEEVYKTTHTLLYTEVTEGTTQLYFDVDTFRVRDIELRKLQIKYPADFSWDYIKFEWTNNRFEHNGNRTYRILPVDYISIGEPVRFNYNSNPLNIYHERSGKRMNEQPTLSFKLTTDTNKQIAMDSCVIVLDIYYGRPKTVEYDANQMGAIMAAI